MPSDECISSMMGSDQSKRKARDVMKKKRLALTPEELNAVICYSILSWLKPIIGDMNKTPRPKPTKRKR